MAFDRPIEADRIDDFNLFSAFVRAPLWILGGVLGSNASTLDNDDEDIALPRRLDDDVVGSSSSEYTKNRMRLNLKGGNALECDRCGGDCSRDPCCPRSKSKGVHPPLTVDKCPSINGLRRTKNLSWSDESGRSLVEYNDESNIRHEPSPYTSATTTSAPKAVKSALKRSTSVRSDAHKIEPGPGGTRYIPNMTRADGNGLIMPTRPFGPDATNNGVDSPQWGWYINTTPPTPEMYHGQSNNKSSKARAAGSTASTQNQPKKSCQNQVFQNLQNKNAPMGWTSVPI